MSINTPMMISSISASNADMPTTVSGGSVGAVGAVGVVGAVGAVGVVGVPGVVRYGCRKKTRT